MFIFHLVNYEREKMLQEIKKKVNKRTITRQLPPMLVEKIYSWSKDQGISQNEGLRILIEDGFKARGL